MGQNPWKLDAEGVAALSGRGVCVGAQWPLLAERGLTAEVPAVAAAVAAVAAAAAATAAASSAPAAAGSEAAKTSETV